MMLKKIVCDVLLFYKKNISPFLGAHCRFYPSCSSYAHQAIIKRGIIVGMGLSAARILKCNPLYSGGIDQIE